MEAVTEAPDRPPEDVIVLSELEQIRLLTDPLRLRILEQLMEEARTTKQVADRLGEKPTKLYHHMDALERAGAVRLVKTRRKRGTTEKYFRATARTFRAEPGLFDPGAGELPSELGEAGAVVLETAASELRRLSGSWNPRDRPGIVAGVKLTADAATLARYDRRLKRLLKDLQEESPEPPEDAQSRFLVLGWFPAAGSGDAE